MTNRRQVIKAGFAAILASPIVLTRNAAATNYAATCEPLVICDLQYEASVSFGREARQRGAPVRTIRSDITSLWQEELIPLWRSRSAIQLGMTGYDALFCFGMMAREWGMRAVYRMHHRPQADGTIVHEPIGHTMPRTLQYLKSTDWSRRNAELLFDRAKLPFDAGDAAACRRAADESTGLCRDSLVSWIFAPIAPPILTASQMLKEAS